MKRKRKFNKESKQTKNQQQKQQNKGNTLPTQHNFQNNILQVVYLFLSQKFVKQARTIYIVKRGYLLCAISFYCVL